MHSAGRKGYRRRGNGRAGRIAGILICLAAFAVFFMYIFGAFGNGENAQAQATPPTDVAPTATPEAIPEATPLPTVTPEPVTASERDAYRMDVYIDPDTNRLACVQQLDWTNGTGDAIGELVLRMYPNALIHGDETPLAIKDEAFPSGIKTTGIMLKRVLVNGRSAQYTLDGKLTTTLRVPFFDELQDGETVTLTLSWYMDLDKGFFPLSYSASGIQAAWFYPMAATYSNGGWALTDIIENGKAPWYYPAADYDVCIRVNGEYTVASTGSITTTANNGDESIYMVSAHGARDFAFALTTHKAKASGTASGVAITACAQNSDNAKKLVQYATGAIEFYTGLVGEPHTQSLALIQTTLTGDSSVHDGLIMVDATQMKANDAEYRVALAIARQWFGCAVGAGYADDRDLHTPLTQYMAARYLESIGSAQEDAANEASGAALIASLRETVGSARFDPALKSYYDKYLNEKGGLALFAELFGEDEATVNSKLGR